MYFRIYEIFYYIIKIMEWFQRVEIQLYHEMNLIYRMIISQVSSIYLLNKRTINIILSVFCTNPRNLTSLHISCLNCVWCTRWERQKTDSISKTFSVYRMVGSSESSTWSNKSYQTHNEVKVKKSKSCIYVSAIPQQRTFRENLFSFYSFF